MDNNEQTVEAWLCERFKYHLQINHKPSKVEIAKMKNDIPMSRGFVWIDNPPIRFSDGVICNPFVLDFILDTHIQCRAVIRGMAE